MVEVSMNRRWMLLGDLGRVEGDIPSKHAVTAAGSGSAVMMTSFEELSVTLTEVECWSL